MAQWRAFCRTDWALALLAAVLAVLPARAQYGLVLSGAGPINRSMAGVGTATAIDSIGALYWNPASISGLERPEMAFGVELLFPESRLASTLPAGSVMGLLPTSTLSGSDKSDPGVFALPTIGLVYSPDDSPWTFGLGIFPVAGFGVNYPASLTNPLLTPQPPAGLGLGSVYSQFQAFEITPQVSCHLTDHLSVGVGPAIALGLLQVDPAVFAAPDNASGNGFPTYPSATHTHYNWGGGVQGGVYYALDGGLRLGASLRSPLWMERFTYHSTDQLGRPRTTSFNLDIPMIVSAGLAYTGFSRWVFGIDTHYLDYHDTDGFRSASFDNTGALQGLGWRSIWAVALGMQYQVLNSVSLRMGYSFNQNPITGPVTSQNVASPLLIQNLISFGASYYVNSSFSLSAAYVHMFENSSTGPIVAATGVIPGSSVTSTASADSFIFGGTVRFGGRGNP